MSVWKLLHCYWPGGTDENHGYCLLLPVTESRIDPGTVEYKPEALTAPPRLPERVSLD